MDQRRILIGSVDDVLRINRRVDLVAAGDAERATVLRPEVGEVGESFDDAFSSIVNYCAMAVVQLRHKFDFEEEDLSSDQALEWYDSIFKEAFELMESKNHDYGEAWRDMRVSSLTDLILTKILRIKKIEDNSGKTIASEGVEGNYFVMLNYAVFALIHLELQG